MTPRLLPPEVRVRLVHAALCEAGYPDAVVAKRPKPGAPNGLDVSSDAPLRVLHRAFELLAEAERRPYPDFDEWDAWRRAGWPRPAWWAVEP